MAIDAASIRADADAPRGKVGGSGPVGRLLRDRSVGIRSLGPSSQQPDQFSFSEDGAVANSLEGRARRLFKPKM